MLEGRLIKPEKDFTKDVDIQLAEAEELARQSNAQAAVEKLLVLEKKTRQASDLQSTSRILVGIVMICKEAGDWDLLKEQVLLLSKKLGQLRQATTKMVQTVMGFLDDTPNRDVKYLIVNALRTVTEGKIFVEVERARVTRILSNMKKEQGDTNAAAEILCELQVETFGSMTRREKTEFILEQVSLCIEKNDWIQANILGRKINTRYFARKPRKTPEELEKEKKEREEHEKKRGPDDPPMEPEDDVTDLKLRFYEQQIILSKQDGNYLDVCKHYRRVLDTEAVEKNECQLRAVLQRVIYFVILAPYDNEQFDLLHRIYKDIRNSQIPQDAELLKLFTIPELMRWPLVAQKFGPHLCSTDIFDQPSDNPEISKAAQRFKDLRRRVIEHNIRVVAKYYSRIQVPRLQNLLDLDEEETEKYISELVTAKTIYARIDRPARVVNFSRPRGADDVLNEWSGDMKTLLDFLERIGHLITKEEMMARIQPNMVEKGKETKAH